MARVNIGELDSLFVLRHAQRADKLAATVSSIDFDYSHHLLEIHDSFNQPLATFHATQNKSNNGYTQAKELGAKVLNYVQNHVKASTVVLRFHTSPYLRCVETIKHMVDHMVKQHKDHTRQIKVVISIDHVLSEWLNTELDVNYFPPNDNGETLLATAIQYLNSNIPFNRNDSVKIVLQLHESYKHGNPGIFSESLMQQYSRLNRGLISIVKETQRNLTTGQDTKDIVLLMTHGACVRSIVSKLIGRSLMVEIPLASATLAKPQDADSSHYYWKVEETDIELRNQGEFKSVDIYSSRDPFQDIQTTFQHSLSSQLNFKSDIPASKTENFNRIRSQSLLNARVSHDSDSDSDSDEEGISFKATPAHRAHSSRHSHHHIDQSRRFRSSSLFGPVLNNPFFEDSENNKKKSIASRKNSFERVKASLRGDEDIVSPTEKRPSQYNLSALVSTNTPTAITPLTSSTNITPVTSTNKLRIYQNIDANDGIHDLNCETVPDLAELSSNNSSSTSLHDDSHHTKASASIPTTEKLSTSLETLDPEASNASISTIKPSTTSLFDRDLIEESLREIQNEKPSEHQTVKNDWMNFKDSSSMPSTSVGSTDRERTIDTGNKFKIDLYGKKNRTYKLSLYDEDDDGDSHGGWFLGSNRY